jgi:hypothetical protein
MIEMNQTAVISNSTHLQISFPELLPPNRFHRANFGNDI